MNIQQLVNEHIVIWNNSDSGFQPFGEQFLFEEKRKREEGVMRFSRSMKNDIDFKNYNSTKKEQIEFKVQSTFGLFFKNAYNFSSNESAIITNMGFSGVTKRFMAMAKRFDPEVKIDDVFQACRNLWIVNSLQIMMGEPVKLTPSIFAYSMLYPYSDNLLDDPSISNQQKIEFSKRFRLKLEGEEVIPANEREKIIFDLVSLIEGEWDRSKYPKVFQSLLAIHDAQTKSIYLSKSGDGLKENELLSICIEKGGTSVLADGYLINGCLTEEQERFCFGFGTFLQFIDDIQDLKEDTQGEIKTLFTNAVQNKEIDEFTNKTVSFTGIVMSDLSCFNSENIKDMQSLMTKSINFMLVEAIGLNSKSYSKEYVECVELYSPFSFDFIRKRRSNADENRISLMKKIESFVFDDQKVALQV